MAKDKIAYVCSNCGQESTKWIGKCPNCGQWNTFKEIRIANDTGTMAAKTAAHAVRHALTGKNKPLHLREISAQDEPRIDMHDAELNRVLGGGLEHCFTRWRAWNWQEYTDITDNTSHG